MMTKYVVIQCDDWTGMYKDGKLVQEGHEISSRDMCHELGIDFKFDEGVVDDYLMENGRFPENLEDLPEGWR